MVDVATERMKEAKAIAARRVTEFLASLSPDYADVPMVPQIPQVVEALPARAREPRPDPPLVRDPPLLKDPDAECKKLVHPWFEEMMKNWMRYRNGRPVVSFVFDDATYHAPEHLHAAMSEAVLRLMRTRPIGQRYEAEMVQVRPHPRMGRGQVGVFACCLIRAWSRPIAFYEGQFYKEKCLPHALEQGIYLFDLVLKRKVKSKLGSVAVRTVEEVVVIDGRPGIEGANPVAGRLNDARLMPFSRRRKEQNRGLERVNVVAVQTTVYGQPHLILFPCRDIAVGDELLLDYGVKYWEVLRSRS